MQKNKPESEIRQQMLENYGEKIFRSIEAETMADDLKRIYRRKICPFCFLLGIICLPLLAFLLYVIIGTDAKAGFSGIIAIGLVGALGIIGLWLGIYHLFGLSVSSFIKKEHERIDKIERSYMSGNMVCGSLGGINIGTDYCVHYDAVSVGCFRTDEIESAEATDRIVSNHHRSCFDSKKSREISIEIKLKNSNSTYKVNMNELQLEYICDELTRYGVKIDKNNK